VDEDDYEEAVDYAVEDAWEALREAGDKDGARKVRLARGDAAAPGEAVDRVRAVLAERGTLPEDHPAVEALARLDADTLFGD
jgi:hypothetical protein